MAAGDVMTGAVALLAGDYITLRRGLGYRSRVSERYLRAFARYLDREGHDGPVPLERSLDWAASTASADPCNPARRLTAVRGFLRHLSALDAPPRCPPRACSARPVTASRRTCIPTARSATCCGPLAGWPRPAGCGRTATPRCSGCWPAPGCGSPRRCRWPARTST